MKKLIVFPNLPERELMMAAEQLKNMGKNDILLATHDIKIYDIDNCKIWSKRKISQFLKENNIKITSNK